MASLLVRVRDVADEIANVARDIHPWESQSGDTESSITVTSTTDGARVSAGEAARYLEFGAYGRVYPFLRPAADAVVPGGRR